MTPKIGRNEKCICGSGRKYKHCCGAAGGVAKTNASDLSSVLAMGMRGNVLQAYGRSMLRNRIEREAPNIAKDFDCLCQEYVSDLEEVYSCAASALHFGLNSAKEANDEFRTVLGILLSNCLKSFTAGFALLRMGWRLQPYQCIRNAFEALSVAIHVAITPKDFERFKNDKLKSTTTFQSARKLMPIFGRVYGDFSQQFVHIGKPFRHIQRAQKYTEDEKELWGCLLTLLALIWLIYEVVELVFYPSITTPIFWKHLSENRYEYAPTQETMAWKLRHTQKYHKFNFSNSTAGVEEHP